jgi:BirA family biotin operon repressor/biotin-[acetyl-CoA-carboxylase] ligase
MTRLDPDGIRRSLAESAAGRIAGLEAFEEIESTNSYLLGREAPAPGLFRVALTDNQVAGRGRHGKTWQSPRGSGLALSVAYTFAETPANLAALTLAIGVGAIEALARLGIVGVELKWPNDLIAGDGKLGGILTETQSLPDRAIMVVTGLGLNLDLDPAVASRLETGGGRRAVDLVGFAGSLPCRNQLAATLIDSLCETFVAYESTGFAAYAGRWMQSDWLRGRALTVDTPKARLQGVGAGIADDGALLVAMASGDVSRISSGTIVATGAQEVLD